ARNIFYLTFLMLFSFATLVGCGGGDDPKPADQNPPLEDPSDENSEEDTDPSEEDPDDDPVACETTDLSVLMEGLAPDNGEEVHMHAYKYIIDGEEITDACSPPEEYEEYVREFSLKFTSSNTVNFYHDCIADEPNVHSVDEDLYYIVTKIDCAYNLKIWAAEPQDEDDEPIVDILFEKDNYQDGYDGALIIWGTLKPSSEGDLKWVESTVYLEHG